jgi:hypothetical protein
MKSNTEFKDFDNAMRRALSVSKAELQQRLDAEKLANQGKPKRGPKAKTSTSVRASICMGVPLDAGNSVVDNLIVRGHVRAYFLTNRRPLVWRGGLLNPFIRGAWECRLDPQPFRRVLAGGSAR